MAVPSSLGSDRVSWRTSFGSLVAMTEVVPVASRTTAASMGSVLCAEWQSSPARRAIGRCARERCRRATTPPKSTGAPRSAPAGTARVCSTRCRPEVEYTFGWSGWRDSNPRPSVPQTDALTKLRHSPSRSTMVAADPRSDETSQVRSPRPLSRGRARRRPRRTSQTRAVRPPRTARSPPPGPVRRRRRHRPRGCCP